eukprot:874130-Pelagomonas_calceolata.AAC.2
MLPFGSRKGFLIRRTEKAACRLFTSPLAIRQAAWPPAVCACLAVLTARGRKTRARCRAEKLLPREKAEETKGRTQAQSTILV